MECSDNSLIVFTQNYGQGEKVIKRGLNATPLVVKKYGLAKDEVMAFSSWEGRRTALTAFHFHPEFPINRRRSYMEYHNEGREIVAEVSGAARDERRERLRAWREKAAVMARGTGKTLRSSAHILIALALSAVQEQVR